MEVSPGYNSIFNINFVVEVQLTDTNWQSLSIFIFIEINGIVFIAQQETFCICKYVHLSMVTGDAIESSILIESAQYRFRIIQYFIHVIWYKSHFSESNDTWHFCFHPTSISLAISYKPIIILVSLEFIICNSNNDNDNSWNRFNCDHVFCSEN